MPSTRHEMWPFSAELVSSALDDGYSTLGPLSTAVALLDTVAALDAATLPETIETRLGPNLPLFSDIRRLADTADQALSKIEQALRRIRTFLRECAVTREAVVCTAYEAILWDPIFADLPNVLFFVVTSKLATASARLSYFPNVKPVCVDEIVICRTVSRSGNEDRRGSAIVITSYGHPKGESSHFVTIEQKQAIEQSLFQGFNACIDLRLFDQELSSRPRTALLPVDYPERMSMRQLLEGFTQDPERTAP